MQNINYSLQRIGFPDKFLLQDISFNIGVPFNMGFPFNKRFPFNKGVPFNKGYT